ncbi:hypothetical protein HMPREF0653_02650, partial [Prevotella disiens JCM 6334 = ATCC 29426]
MSCSQQVLDMVFCEKRAANLTEDAEVAALVPAFGDFGIDAHALTATLGAAIGGI